MTSHSQKLSRLQSLTEKSQLQNKKIKLFRKENQEIEAELSRNSARDTGLLLANKDLAASNDQLVKTIEQLIEKMKQDAAFFTEMNGSQNGSEGNVLKVTTKLQNLQLGVKKVNSLTHEIQLTKEDGVADEMIRDLCHFSQLKSVMLSNIALSNDTPLLMCKTLTQLQKLHMNQCSISDQALLNLSNLAATLKVLELRGNQLTDSSCAGIGKLTQLKQLTLARNLQLTHQCIGPLGNLTALQYLDMANCKLTDESVDDLIKLNSLTHLYLLTNLLAGKGAKKLVEFLNRLIALDIRFNRVEPTDKQVLKAGKPPSLQLLC